MKHTLFNRIISIVLSLLIVIGITAISRETVLADTDTTSGLTYTITNGKATITGFTAPKVFNGILAIPDTLGGVNVTSIGYDAFDSCSNLTSITIPNSVTSIGDYAFWGCSSLTSITIPSSVTSIGDNAFYKCYSLMSVTVDASNTAYKSIDGILYSKDGTNLICCPAGKSGSITIPSSVTSIGYAAFAYCSTLTSITIPSSVTSIGGFAVYYCSSLTSITIPSSVTSIGDYAFEWCSSLTSITIPSSVTSIGGGAFAACHSLTGITIPSSVTSIGDYAFYNCTSLTGITIPSSVTSIGGSAFYDCTSLTSITIPSSVTSIGDYAFNGCSELTDAYFYGNAPTMGAEVFVDCAPSFTVHYLTREFVTRFYQLCLGREPDAGGLTYWADSLLSGSLSGADLSNQLVFSEEFRNRNVTNDEYITIMYKSFFGRDPDAGGKNYWMSVFDSGMSRYYVLAGFVNSEEFKNICNTYGISVGSLAITAPVDKYPQITSFVTRFYKLCLNRMPDAAGLDHWVVQLQTQNLAGANVAHDIVTSEEFTNRGTTNDAFVEIMYKAFFDRTSEASGKAYWTGRLAAGASRYTVLAGFVNSQEFTNICTTYGINRGSM